MNYPIWELPTMGGGTLIALISIFHVYIAHLAVGGGIFIWLTDWKGYRDNNPAIHDYIRAHTWFFLLLTMVFGGVTGVGIWFIIALVNPAATSMLIHSFVFGWAIEWVFFVGEIVALLVYHYKFNVLSRKQRLTLAFLYALFAWLSLVIITGILAFMLTPGEWVITQSFWDGFFNPTYIPSMIFRTFIAIMIAGLFGYITVVFRQDSEFRTTMMRYCSLWVLIPTIGAVVFGWWYYRAVPEAVRYIAFDLNTQTVPFVSTLLWTSILIVIGGAIFMLKLPLGLQRALVFVVVIIGLVWMGGFEYIREIARKPFVINHVMYSTSILKTDLETLNRDGVLKHAKWSAIKEVTPANKREAGRELFNIQCLSCHTIDGIRNDVLPLTENLTYMGTLAQLVGQGRIQTYMPPFVGTQPEREALAEYIIGELHQKSVVTEPEPLEIKKVTTEIPPFDKEKDEYVLLAWNDLGMHCISDSDPWFVILPPANTLEAQLIRRGEVPEVITAGVEIHYHVEEGFENPAAHVEFWKYAKKNFGASLENNVGLFGNGMSGTMKYHEDRDSYIVEGIPVVPYKDDGSYNPYPTFTVEARDAETGEVLIATKVVAPTSTAMGCRNCHGGPWQKGTSGIHEDTAINILKAHDRLNGTTLYQDALAGNPKLCQSCHADPALGTEGTPDRLNFSASMHGWHANYMPFENGEACGMCHPAQKKGNTRCNRGIHGQLGLDCTPCHGTMSDHALSLLKGQADNASAQRLMANLTPDAVTTVEEINPRQPWINEPDCLNCHVDYEKPVEGYSGYNEWHEFTDLYRNRFDEAEVVRCIACHNSTHSIFPARNTFDRNRDNIQPLQYSGQPLPVGSEFSCETCHTITMEGSIHHDNMERPFRNKQVLED